ncbi:hypothetical protein [Haloferax volcanii]|uniref:PD(D/E)XK endonuclease domain-containing protein n=1 Tax=Haloferax volcanii TaxID=2246 RepID=A0A558FUW9_HALVO|nr:hypothetical protein [Haloferax volcanii]TVT89295.1 hypothetical protein FQA18_18565 [Haloferax volcanii]
MTFPDVTRREMRRIDERAGDENGEFAERLVAAHYGITHANDRADWYDCVHEERGTKYEVKATQVRIDGLDPDSRVEVGGRFRLWEGQTRSLLNSDAQNTAWFVFVLLDENGSPVDHRRMRPSTVWSLVRDEFGGWDESGHREMGRQQKVPIEAVF